ncbi:tail fiber assembly protein [Pluralibacter gergoviae]|uniref:tail fiber assembly protein n=1 Tax=Pluralibacter gergoviae TaxID=61647 RepID=UPI003EE03D03
MAFKMTDTAQTIRIFNLRADTQEFIGPGDAYIAPRTGLPAYCTEIEPPEIPDGFAGVFDHEAGEWSVQEDHRGLTVYRTDSGAAVRITELGPLPDGVTSLAPDGSYQKWDGSQWVADPDAEKQAQVRDAESMKKALMQAAGETISTLQDAVELELATDDETTQLEQWKKYRVLLNRIDTSAAPDIAWPEQPR